MLDPAEFGKAMAAIVKEATAPLLRRIEELEAREAPTASDVVRLVLASDEIKGLVNLEAEAYLSENPPERGEKGQDGAGIADLLIDRDGHLVATMTDGRMKNLGPVVGKDGKPGENGKDGADFSDVEIDYDGERTVTIKGRGGEIVKRIPLPLDKGYWSEGQYEKGDIVTHDGIAWIALQDTKATPTVANKQDWRIFARKGRDGRDGRNGIDKTGPVKL